MHEEYTKMKSKLIIIVLAIALVSLLGYISLRTAKTTGSAIRGEEVFNGFITNVNLEAGKLEGTGVYDRSCNMIGNGFTQCDAGIETKKGLLNFNYKHNMAVQPCIAQGDKLEVEILDSEGKARVRRLI